MTGRHDKPTGDRGRCNVAGKLMWPSRKAAKQAMRRAHPGADLSVYPCGDHYHYGHLAARVKAGTVDRHDVRRHRHWWEDFTDPEHLGVGAVLQRCRVCGVTKL